MKYKIYPVIFTYDIPGQVGITFPDFCGCTGQCDITRDIAAYAAETLEFHIESMIEDGEELPEPSDIYSFKTAPNQAIFPIKISLKHTRGDAA